MPHPRKEAAAIREKEKKDSARADSARKAEESKWADDDKSVQAKEARRLERERKADEQLMKAREKAALLEAEEAANSNIGKNKKTPPPKIRQSDIKVSALSALSFDTKKKKPAAPIVVNDLPIEPNLNREMSEVEVARGSTAQAVAAISSALKSDLAVDIHPEKRMKALHAAFEERRMRELVSEKPNLKRSQYKDMIFREWLKSPENPMRNLQQ
jgi:hypothetical protein